MGTDTAPTAPAAGAPSEVRVYPHSPIMYWWIVWAYGFFCALLTRAQGEIFTIGGGNTLPTLVWGMVRTSLDPTINAMATLLIMLSIGSTVVALRVSRYRG